MLWVSPFSQDLLQAAKLAQDNKTRITELPKGQKEPHDVLVFLYIIRKFILSP